MASKVQKISIALPKEMVADIRYAVDSGQYASASEVVREAVREWKGPPRRSFPPNYPYVDNIEDLRRMVQEGIDSLNRGEGIPAEKVYAAMRKRIKAIAAAKKRKRG